MSFKSTGNKEPRTVKRLERGRKLKARNNSPAYTSMHKGIQSDRVFPPSKRARGVASLSANEFFEKICNYYNYNFNSLLTLLWGEHLLLHFTCTRMNVHKLAYSY